MRVVFDSSFLLLTQNPDANASVDHAAEKIAELIKNLNSQRATIILPTPVLSEVLVRAGPGGPDFIKQLQKAAAFKICDFDMAAAVELAEMNRIALASGDKRDGLSTNRPWQKIKLDRQILAISRVQRAEHLYIDDDDMIALALKLNFTVSRLSDLPFPQSKLQFKLELDNTE
jgi:hypothetical protein